MSKAYIVTAVNYGKDCNGAAVTLGVFFDKKKAEATLAASMDSFLKAAGKNYYEDELAIREKDGNNGCVWNIEDKEVEIPLTPLQITELNGLAYKIDGGDFWLDELEDLSDEEMDYLKYTLKTTYDKEVK